MRRTTWALAFLALLVGARARAESLAMEPGYWHLGETTNESVDALWTANGNLPTTEYEVECWEGLGFTGTRVYRSDWFQGLHHVVHGLQANTYYSLRVRARDIYNEETEWAVLDGFWTLPNLPGPLPLGPVTATSVRANWTLNGNPAGTHYFVECWVGDGFGGDKVTDSTWVPDLTEYVFDLSFFVFSGPDRTVSVRVRAENENFWATDWVDLGRAVLPPDGAAPPGTAPFGPITARSIQANWTANGNLEGTEYLVECWQGGDFSGTQIASSGWTTGLSHDFGSLAVDATHAFRVKARRGGDESVWTVLGVVATHANPPDAAPYGTPPLLTSLVANWTANGNPGDTEYRVECWEGDDFSGTRVREVGWQTALAATLPDLILNTRYICRVQARNRDGVETDWVSLGPTATLAEAPLPVALGPITSSSIQANWDRALNPHMTEYLVECWRGANFTDLKVADSGWQAAVFSHNFTNLEVNREYSFRVRARNLDGVESDWTELGSAFTFAELAEPDGYHPVTETTLRALWGPGANPVGTDLRAEIWLWNRDFGNQVGDSGWVADLTAHEFIGLVPNQQYQVTVQARNGDGVETLRVGLPDVYTLARPPLVEIFGDVTAVSVETRWGDHGNPVWTEYLVECWLGADFSGVKIGESGWVEATTHDFVGLDVNTRYAFRVKARNRTGIETGWVELGDALTFDTYVNPPGIAPFAPIGSTHIQANWMPNANPPDAAYLAECWLGTDFSGPKIGDSGWGITFAWDCMGLEPHTAYTFRAKARNTHGDESVWTVLGTVETMEGGLFVWQRHSSQGIAHVDRAIALFTGGLTVTKDETGIYPSVNFGHGQYAHYSGDHDWPNGAGDYFGLAATAEVHIPSAGEWTFGVNSDDGFRLWIDGVVAAEHPGERGELDTLATLDFPFPGWHTLRLVYFECKVSEEVELFAAPGAHATWSAAAFDLIGDTDNGGLLARVWQPEWPVVPGTAPCAPVTAVSITANWAANGNGAGSSYLVECWEGSGFSSTKLGESGWTALLSFDFAGLTETTEYAFRVKARSADGIESAWTDLGTATTLDTYVNPPGAEPFGPLMATSIQANWDPNGNGPGTDYFIECWEGSGFTGTQIGDSGWIPDLSHEFTGLEIDTEYAFRVKARNAAGIESAWTALGSVYTINHTGFWVRDVKQSGHSLTWVTDAEKLFDGTWPVSDAVDVIRDTVNVGSNGEWGDRYAGDYAFPLNAAYDNSDFATQFTAYVWIPEGGDWSFGVNSDDGMRLWIDGAVVADHPGVRSPGDTVRPTTLAGPAWHALRLVYYEHSHGQCVELFAAQGSHTAWNATDFRLVGDMHNGGLPAVAWDPSLPAPPGWQPLGPVTTTSVRANWLAAGNPDGTEYLVECWLGPDFSGNKLDESGWTLAVNYTFVGLLPDTQYAIRVKARHDAQTESIWTELGTVATYADAPVAQPLGPVQPDSIQANWGVADNPADTDYMAECWAGSGFGGTKLADSGWLDGGVSHTFGGLGIGYVYAFRVKARNRDGVETAWTDLGSEATRESDDTWYVDDDAAPGGDGTSWTTAFQNPQDALAVARAGDQIWVAAGTYTPGTARTDSFQLKQGVALYGGFAGAEAVLDQRNWTANVTILSGDIGTQGANSDNCYHVVTGADFATLDGFTVTAGEAIDAASNDRGGGLFCVGVSPTVRHCTFHANRALLGGALYHWDGAHATYVDCVFSDNVGEQSAGVAYTHGSSPTFTDCRFLRNEAQGECGGCDYNLYTAHPTYTRCLFARNTAENYGGAVRNHETASPTFTDCVFYANRSNFQGGTLFNDHNAYPTLRNSIVWANSAPSVNTFFNHTGAGVTVTYSCVQGGHAGTGNVSLDPAFVDPDADDYRLKSATGHWTETGWVPDAETSPCIDGGDPADGFGAEPSPNGARINMGIYGGTGWASLSVPDPEPPAVTALTPATDAPLPDSPTAIAVTFDEAMDASSVSASSFLIVGSGGTGLFDDGDDVPVDTSGVAMSASTEATLDLAATPLAVDIYRLTLVGTGQSPIRDANGNALDGEFDGSFPSGNGGAGGDFVAYIHVMVAGNHVPVIQPFDLVYKGQGELWKTYTCQVDADDADGDTLTYELTDAPAGMTIDPDGGLITWDPTPADIGRHTFTVRVDDGRYGFATRTFDLRIFNVNELANPDFEIGSIAGWTEHGWGGGLQVHGVLGERVTLERTRWYCYQAGTGVNGYLEQTVTLVPGREHDLFLEIVSYSNGINADGGTITVKANGVQIGRYAFGGNSKTTIYRTIDTTFTPTQSENVFQVHISRGYGLGWGWSGTPINFLDNLHVCESQYYDDTYPVVADISPVPAGTLDTRIAQFVVAFNKPIDGATVTADSFQLIRSVDGTLGNGDDEPITPVAVTLDNAFQATLDLNGVDLPDDLYQVVLRGDGADAVKDTEANALDGDYTGSLPSGDGTAGGDFIATFTYQCPVPSIAHDPTSLVFRGTEGGANPASDVVDVTNMGHPDSLLEWTVTSDAAWLSVTPGSGTVGYGPFDTVQVDADLAGLTAGVYAGNLTITGERAPNSPVTVPVTLYVAGAGGLTAHWKLDDGSGTTATDSSCLGNHGTVEGAAWATGIDNGALDFDGDDDVVRCPHVAADGLTDLTVACWVRTTANRIQSILSGAHSGNDNQFLLALSDTVTVTVHVKGPSRQWVLPAPVADGTWHHITVTRDGTTGAVTLYVDAVSQGTKTLDPGALIVDENGLVIGQEQDSVGGGFDPEQTLEGRLDDVRIYNRVLADPEIGALLGPLPPEARDDVYGVAQDGTLLKAASVGVLANDSDVNGDPLTAVLIDGVDHGALTLDPDGGFTYVPDGGYAGPDSFTYKASDGALDSAEATVTIQVGASTMGLGAHWKLDDGSGAAATDSSPNDYHGTLINGPVWAAGVKGGALEFDGSDDRVGVPHEAANGLDDMTLCVWFRTRKSGIQTFLSGANATRDNELLFDLLNATTVRIMWQAAERTWTVPATSDGRWHHLALTRDGATTVATLYLDGRSVGTNTTLANAVSIASGGLVIGQDQDSVGGGFDPSQSFQGTLDDVRIYDRVLSHADIMGVMGQSPPQAEDDSYLVAADSALTVPVAEGVLVNDSDPDGDPLFADPVGLPAHGSVTLAPDGSFQYTPEAGFSGEDTFTYTASDGVHDSEPATVRINVGDIVEGLVAHWKLDEGEGTTAHDSSGNNLHGTVHGAAWASGVLGGALDFDGTNDYVDFGDVLNGLAVPFSFTAWVYHTPTGTTGLFSLDDGSTYYGFWVHIHDDDSIHICYGDGSGDGGGSRRTKVSQDTVPHHRWTHVACIVRGATDMTVYLNGVDAGGSYSGTGGSMKHSSAPARLGLRSRWGPYYQRGPVDDVRIYDRALTDAEVQAMVGQQPPWAGDDRYALQSGATLNVEAVSGVLANDTDVNGDPLSAVLVDDVEHGTLALDPDGSFTYTPEPTFQGEDRFTYKANDGTADSNIATVTLLIGDVVTGLVAHWKFDEGEGTTAYDSSGNNNHGTLTNGPTWTSGVTSGALQFDGDVAHVEVGASDVPLPWTAAFILKRIDSSKGAVRLMDSPAGSLRLEQWNYTNKVGFTKYGVSDYTFNYYAPVDEWIHIVWVADSTSTRLYVDGVQEGTNANKINCPMTRIGGTRDSIVGPVDDIRIYDRALSPEEIAILASLPPTAMPDVYSVAVDGSLAMGAPGVLGNDDSATGSALAAIRVTDVAHGTLDLAADGSFTYAPDPGYTGLDSFVYKANDGATDSNVTTVTFVVYQPVPNLIAHWTLDEGDGNTAYDWSGHDNHGALTNGPAWTSGIRGGSLHFDGTDDFVHCGSSASLNSPTTQMTLCAWVQNDANGGAILGKRNDWTSADNYVIDINAGSDKYRFSGGNSAGWGVAEAVRSESTDGRWHLIVWVIDTTQVTAADRLRLYLDGARITSFNPYSTPAQDSPIPLSTDIALGIGARRINIGGEAFFDGRLDDLRIYDRALTPTEIGDLFGNVPPEAEPDAYAIAANGSLAVDAPGVLGNDTDRNGDAMAAELVDDVAHGALALDGDGSFTYTPAAGFTGSDSFTYQARDSEGEASEIATVTIDVLSLRVAAIDPAPSGLVYSSPAAIVATLDRDVDPATISTSTFIVVRSGGDNVFGDGDDVVIPPAGIALTAPDEATFDLTGVQLPVDLYQVRLVGTGPAPITSTDGIALDGDFSGSLPSGDGMVGGDFVATFRVLALLFEDVTATQFLTTGYGGLGNTFFDVDNDGDLDLGDGTAGYKGNRIYLNDGTGTFQQAPGNAGIPTNSEAHTVIPGDFDNDGDLDFAHGWYWAGGSKVFRNNGNTTFTDVSSSCGVGNPGNIHGGAFGDVDNDGDLDLAFAVNGANRLYINNGSGSFSNQASSRGAAQGDYSTSVFFADYDNDGDIDIFNDTSSGFLLANDGTGHFTNVTGAAGVNPLSQGSGFHALGDIDNDGDLDAYKLNTGVLLNNGDGTFTDITASCGVTASGGSGRNAMWADVDHNGYLDLSKDGELWLNQGDLTFINFAQSGLEVAASSQSVAFGDIDGDGDLDARTVNKLLVNLTNDSHWLIVEPVRPFGTPAFNAKVWVYRAGRLGDAAHLLGYREIIGGCVRLTGSLLYAHFGLPHDSSVDVQVRFLSGRTKNVRGVSRAQKIRVVEPESDLTIIHVDADATGANDGTSWADAFVDLQDGLAAAAEQGTEIWVAEGTYLPTSGADRAATFALVQGVAVYGGFAGTEDDREQRDSTTHVATLSGDIGVQDDAADNVYHVATGADGAVLDGFTVAGGNANGTGSDQHGGGLYCGGVEPTVVGCVFLDNAAAEHGGGIYVADASPLITGCTFRGNTALYGGGLFLAGATCEATVSQCTFDQNSAGQGGAACNGVESRATFDACTFTQNHAATSGGAVLNGDQCAPTFTDCSFTENTAAESGGGIKQTSVTLDLQRCTFTGNEAWTLHGGALHAEQSSATIEGCTFSSNTAGGNGGGASLTDATACVMSDCAFEGNTTDGAGGGVYAMHVTLDVDACTFSSNMAGTSGGGMRVYESALTADDCTWSGNSAGTEGGGLYLNHECTATVSHCLFVGNAADQGGGLYNYWYCSPKVDNCTFTRNTATTSGGAIHNHKYCEPQVTNSILWGNTVGEVDDEIANTISSTPTVAHCCIAGGYTGEGSFDADPLFVDPDGGDYHLKSRAGHWTEGGHVVDVVDSPCIDTGKPTDPVGDEPFPSGGRINVGAYGGTDEASMTYGQTPVVASIEPASGPAHTRGIIAGTDFGDLPGRVVFTPDGGSGVDWAIESWTNGQIAFRVAEGSPVGTGQVRVLRADAYPSSPVAFEVTDPTVIHVDDDNASGIENGTETYPFDTVAEGLAAATAGDTVLVHEGTYAENLTMKSAVILSGEGAGVTVIQGAAGSPALQLPSSVAYAAGTEVRELTLRGGSNGLKVNAKANATAHVALDGVAIADAASHGAWFRASGGARTYGKIAATMTDCRVTNAGEHGILAGAYGYISYCDVQLTLNACELDSNTNAGIRVETEDNGKRVKVWLNDCEVHHNNGQGIRGHSDGDTINLYTNRCHVHDNGSDGAYLSSYWYAFLYHQSQDSQWVDNAGSGVRITCSTNDAITSTTLTGDELSRNGGHGLYAHTPDGAREIPKATLKRCTVVGNADHGMLARVGGGFSRGYFTVRDCLVADNVGGGLRFETAGSWSGTKARLDATVNVSTIANNGPVGLSRNLWDTRVTVRNSTITGHTDDLLEMAADNVHYSDIGDGTHDGINGNISSDPLFVDAAAGDYRLQTGSPCIDAGDPAFTPEAGETDLEGNDRVLNGRVNMGAYEKPADTLPELAAIEPVPAPIEVENSTGGVVQVELALTRFVTDLTAWQFRIDHAVDGPAVTAVEPGSWWDTNPPESFASAFTPDPGFWVVMGLMTDTSGKSGIGALATLTLDCAGIAAGTYILPITATELVKTDLSLIDHTVIPLEVTVVDAEPPAPVPEIQFGESDSGGSAPEMAGMGMTLFDEATVTTGKTTTTISMYCGELDDATPPVLYQFTRGAEEPGTVIRDWHEDPSCADVGLTPNTLYSYRARAKDSTVEGNTTIWSASVSTYTLPIAPDVSCDKSTGAPHDMGDTFTFTNDAGWGPGTLDHYHYVWTTQPTHAFDGSEAEWAAGTPPLVATSAGDWYLHLISHSPAHDAGESATIGPFAVGSAPAAAPTGFTHVANAPDSITWAWTDNAATETGFRVDPAGGTVGADVTEWTETGLAANAPYTRHVHALNAFGDSPASNDHTACTSIETPTGVDVSAVTTTTAELEATGSFSNLADGSSGLFIGEAGGHTEGIAEWIQETTAVAAGLTPNAAYAFRAKARNAEGDETALCSDAIVCTLASQPGAEALSGVAATSAQANWNAGSPANSAGTAYRAECWQGTTRVGDSGWVVALSHVFTVTPSAAYTFRVKARNAAGIETAWTDLGSAVTPPNPPGAVIVDMDVMKDGNLNPTAPGCRSLTLLGIEPNGNPATTCYAIRAGSFWLRFVDDGRGNVDVYADGAAPEWRTASEWAGKRLRGLTPDTAYGFDAKARNALDVESALVAAGTYSTNKDGDVDRGNTVSVRDIIFIRNALVQGGEIGVHYSWATDVNDNRYRRTDVGDMAMTQRILLTPAP